MFKKERILVDTLIEQLHKSYGIAYMVREFSSGNNRADLVYTNKIERNKVIFDDFTNAYYYNEYFRKKIIGTNELKILNKNVNRKFNKFLFSLEEQGYIKINNNNIENIKRVDPVTKNLIALEAKLSDWRSGIEQALRYKKYANEVYVAIEESYISKVDLDLFYRNKVGLMAVSESSLKIIIKGKKESIKTKDIHYYLCDKFLEELKI